jgi:hypothetical protein
MLYGSILGVQGGEMDFLVVWAQISCRQISREEDGDGMFLCNQLVIIITQKNTVCILRHLVRYYVYLRDYLP